MDSAFAGFSRGRCKTCLYSFIVVTVSAQDAKIASGLLGVADFAAMPDEVEVGGVVGFGRKERLKVGVGVFDRHFFGAQAEAAGDPVNVGVYGKGGAAKRELKDDGRRLWPHAVEPGEPGAGRHQ